MSFRPRRPVLDHDRLGTEQPVLLDGGALELRVRELLAHDVEKVEARALHAPGRACGIVGEGIEAPSRRRRGRTAAP